MDCGPITLDNAWLSKFNNEHKQPFSGGVQHGWPHKGQKWLQINIK